LLILDELNRDICDIHCATSRIVEGVSFALADYFTAGVFVLIQEIVRCTVGSSIIETLSGTIEALSGIVAQRMLRSRI